MTLNGITIDWREEGDLPSMCCQCPFFFCPSSSVPGIAQTSSRGLCTLRGNMEKDRWADAPQACLRLFRKCLKYGPDERLVIVLKND